MAGLAALVLNIFQSLLTVPILLSFWTVDTFGLWSAIAATAAIFISLDTGHQTYLGNLFNRLWVEDRSQLAEVVRSGMRIAVAIGICELAVATCMLWAGGTSGLLGPAAASRGAEVALLLNLVFWAINGSIGGILVRLYVPVGLYSWSQWLGIIYRFGGFFAVVVAVSSGASLVGAMVAQIIAWLGCNAFTFWDLRRRFPEVHPWWKGGSWSVAWTNFRFSLVLTVNGFFEQFSSNGLVVLVGKFLNPTGAALFSTVRTMGNFCLQGSALMLAPLTPDLIRYHLSGEGRKLAAVFSTSWLLGTSVVSCGLIAGLLVVEPLYAIWTRGSLPLDVRLFALIATGVAIRQWAAPFQTYLASLNHLWSQSAMAFVRGSVGLVIPALLIPSLGLWAAGLGILAAELVAAAISVYVVVPKLRLMAAGFPYAGAFCSLLQIASASTLWLLYANGHRPALSWAGGGTLLVAGLAWGQWAAIPLEVRTRLLAIVR